MTYNPQTPQPADIPADTQDEFLTNFQLLNQLFGQNHVQFGNTVVDAHRSSSAKFDSPGHLLEDGMTVVFSHLKGIKNRVILPWGDGDPSSTEYNPINGNSFVVTVVDEDTFTIPFDASGFIDYYTAEPGDYLVTSSDYKYGQHRKVNFVGPLDEGPKPVPLNSALYTKVLNPTGARAKKIKKTVELYFQNQTTGDYPGSVRLTNIAFDYKNPVAPYVVNSKNGTGIKSPWGIIFNYGIIQLKNTVKTFDFPVPYRIRVLSIIAVPIKFLNIDSFWVDDISLTQFQGLGRIASGGITDPPPLNAYYLAIGE